MKTDPKKPRLYDNALQCGYSESEMRASESDPTAHLRRIFKISSSKMATECVGCAEVEERSQFDIAKRQHIFTYDCRRSKEAKGCIKDEKWKSKGSLLYDDIERAVNDAFEFRLKMEEEERKVSEAAQANLLKALNQKKEIELRTAMREWEYEWQSWEESNLDSEVNADATPPPVVNHDLPKPQDGVEIGGW